MLDLIFFNDVSFLMHGRKANIVLRVDERLTYNYNLFVPIIVVLTLSMISSECWQCCGRQLKF